MAVDWIYRLLHSRFTEIVQILVGIWSSFITGPKNVGPKPEERVDSTVKLFLIPTILTRMTLWMEPAQLFKLRPTCRAWNEEMTRRLRLKQAPIECRISERGSRVPPPLSQNEFPFKKLRIVAVGNGGVGGRRLLMARGMQRLFSVCASHLTMLQIQISSCSGGVSAEPAWVTGLRRLLFNDTPNLCSLKLTTMRGWIDEDRSSDDLTDDAVIGAGVCCLLRLRSLEIDAWFNCCRFLAHLTADLIRAANCLHSLSVDSVQTLGVAVGALAEGAEGRGSLRELSVSYSLPSALITERLIELSRNGKSSSSSNGRCGRLKLTSFQCVIGWSGSDSSREQEVEKLIEFLQWQAPSLRILSLSATTPGLGQPRPQVQLPVSLPVLEELIIHGRIDLLQLTELSSSAALRTLDLRNCTFGGGANADKSVMEALPVFGTVTSNLWSLILPAMFNLDWAAWLSDLYGGWPHLRSLTLRGLQGRHLRQIWSKWQQLEEVDLTLEADQDDGDEEEENNNGDLLEQYLTGINREGCEWLRQRLQVSPGIAGVDHDAALRLKTAPGLPDLKQLKSFKLAFQISPEYRAAFIDCLDPIGWPLTDVAGYYAFAGPNSRLQRISIDGRLGANISDECLAIIRGPLGPCVVITLE